MQNYINQTTFFLCDHSDSRIGDEVALITYKKMKTKPIILEEDASNPYVRNAVACKINHQTTV